MPKILVRAAATALIVTLALAGCSPAPAGAGDRAGGAVTVTVGVLPGADLAPLHLGLEQGFFAEQGITLRIDSLAPSTAGVISAVESGGYDFGYADMLSVLVAAEEGRDVTVVSGAAATSGNVLGDYTALMVPNSSDIVGVADLAGRRVAVDAVGATSHVVLSSLLAARGVEGSSIEWHEVSQLDATEALVDGTVDAAVVVEPFATAAKISGLRAIAYPNAEFAPGLTVAGYFTAASTVAADPDLVAAFASAVARSLEYSTTHQTETRDHIAATLDAQSQVRTRVQLPTFTPEIDRASLELLAEAAVEQGVLHSIDVLDGSALSGYALG